MKSPIRGHRVYLKDILMSIQRIREYTAKGKEEFFANSLVQDGVIRQFSIIGEVVVKLPSRMKAAHSEIPWKKIVGMRNIIIHGYFEVDLPTLWDAIERDLTPLRKVIEGLLGEE